MAGATNRTFLCQGRQERPSYLPESQNWQERPTALSYIGNGKSDQRYLPRPEIAGATEVVVQY